MIDRVVAGGYATRPLPPRSSYVRIVAIAVSPEDRRADRTVPLARRRYVLLRVRRCVS
jgi:hypothetical protein